MPEYHTVEQGEHLAAIAAAYGFMSSATVWEHPGNAGLRELRKNPNILLPGDTVFIPDKEKKEVPVAAGKSSRFQVAREKLKLRLVLEELFVGEGLEMVEELLELPQHDAGRSAAAHVINRQFEHAVRPVNPSRTVAMQCFQPTECAESGAYRE